MLRPFGIALALVVGSVALGAAPASAATDDEVAAWITGATLERLGATTENPELAAALQGAVSEALEAGVISLNVEELAEEAVGDQESVDEAEVEEALADGLDEQGEAWSDVSAEWHAAFDVIKADFAECREAAEAGSNLCAHQFAYEMKVNHVTSWLARHEAKVGDISALPEEEQATALAKLERQGEHAAARLERARVQLERKTGEPVEELLFATDDTSDSKGGPKHDKGGKPDSSDKPDKADKSQGKGNGNGKKGR
ncbi:MAG: hypothetical protein WED09_09200 [Homoserinimonas sp.]